MHKLMYEPMQLLVIVFEDPDFHGQIRKELESVLEMRMIRLIDLLFVWHGEGENVTSLKATQLDEEERVHFGTVIRGLIGYGAIGEEIAKGGTEEGILAAAHENYGITKEDVMEITEAIPENTAAAILIIEHLWARSLKQAIRNVGGILVSQGMLTPELLAVAGRELTHAVKVADEKKVRGNNMSTFRIGPMCSE
ncbi:MAG TPA: DUF1269 domain-containing protein [Methanosarcina sp.]|jgi:uncharacterized membrane protein